MSPLNEFVNKSVYGAGFLILLHSLFTPQAGTQPHATLTPDYFCGPTCGQCPVLSKAVNSSTDCNCPSSRPCRKQDKSHGDLTHKHIVHTL